MEQFLSSEIVRADLSTVSLWLSNFDGLHPELPKPFFVTERWECYANRTGIQEIQRDLPNVEDAWVAQSRLGLAHGDCGPLFACLRSRIALQRTFALDGIGALEEQLFKMDAQAAFLAQAVRQMTPRQCTQLIELAKEWLASNDYWRSGMIRSFARDVKAAIFLIPRNGKTPTDDFRTAESSLDPNFDSTDQSTEAAEGHLTSNDFSYAQPLAPLAIERILITEAAIEESYSGLAQLLRDPFITFTEHLASPKWLRFVLDETSAVRLNSAASDHEFKRVSNILRRNAVRWRMLMLHASIQKFKWEHDRLPDKLGELHLPAYSINPAMNRPFNYTLTPIGYSLTCTEFASPEGEEYEEGPDSMVMDLLADRIRDRHYTY